MDLRESPEESVYRAKVQAFLAEHLPADWKGVGSLSAQEQPEWVSKWRRTLFDNGFLGIAWPTEYGGQGLTKREQVVLAEECTKAGVPIGIPNDTFSVKMMGNTLLRYGTEEQKRKFLPRILSAEDIWCQGYSEPDAGSDLAGISTRAELDGDEWVLNGQKIWNSNAHFSNWVFVLARTDPSAERHRGITFFMVPLDQPGVERRRIEMMSGADEFNGTFFTDARTSTANVVGEVNGGWKVAMTLLGHERGEEAAVNPVLFRMELDRLMEMARERGKNTDPVIRDRLAWCYSRVEVMRYLGARILTDYLRDGNLGPESSISKLFWSEYHKVVGNLAVDIMGADALVVEGRRPIRAYRTDDPGAANSSASWLGALYNATAGTIYAGTSQIQRNIIGETVLGLPK
ncbi:MAG: putative acyl-CoA dehydrogenase [Acidimicrobiia bacterium]|nr:putative acyl-CoA dehydrogenase [Acidimicrobiia bacterium]